MFLATVLIKNIDLNSLLGMHYWQASKFHPYQVITYMFMHAGFSHIFFNMFAVYMFGALLERVWGTKKFLLYYLVSGIGAAFVQQLFWYIEFNNYFNALNQAIVINGAENVTYAISQLNEVMNRAVTIGASGSVFGLLLAFGWLFPEEKLFLIFLPIPIKARWFVLFYGLAELFLGVAQFSGDNIAHFAHLGGMLFGLVLLLIWKKQGKLYS